jgi:serine/threonine protein kinase
MMAQQNIPLAAHGSNNSLSVQSRGKSPQVVVLQAHSNMLKQGEIEQLILKEKYQVQGFARGGGFGEVFIAKHISKDYEVAVKFVSNSVIGSIIHQ